MLAPNIDPQFSMNYYPRDLRTTELRCLGSSDLTHFDDYLASHYDRVNDQNSLLPSCWIDWQMSTLVARSAAMVV